jgi:hypothetical protein
MKHIKKISEYYQTDIEKSPNLSKLDKFENYLKNFRFNHTLKFENGNKIISGAGKNIEFYSEHYNTLIDTVQYIKYNDFSVVSKNIDDVIVADPCIMVSSGLNKEYRPEGYIYGTEDGTNSILNRLKEIVKSYNEKEGTDLKVKLNNDRSRSLDGFAKIYNF